MTIVEELRRNKDLNKNSLKFRAAALIERQQTVIAVMKSRINALTAVKPKVMALFCPKCAALWLLWPKEITNRDADTLNLRDAVSCKFCENAGPDQLVDGIPNLGESI